MIKRSDIPHKMQPGFKVPEKYFEELDTYIQSTLFINKLKQNHFHNGGFKIHENYFDDLPKRIEIRLAESAEDSKQINPLKVILQQPKNIFKKITKYSIAASLLLVAGLSIYMSVKTKQAAIIVTPNKQLTNTLDLKISKAKIPALSSSNLTPKHQKHTPTSKPYSIHTVVDYISHETHDLDEQSLLTQITPTEKYLSDDQLDEIIAENLDEQDITQL